jgi:hypothetical protein
MFSYITPEMLDSMSPEARDRWFKQSIDSVNACCICHGPTAGRHFATIRRNTTLYMVKVCDTCCDFTSDYDIAACVGGGHLTRFVMP